MAACVNCPNEAVHHVADPGVNALDYCDGCLPAHWRGRAQAGHFTPPVDPAPQVAPKKRR